MKTWFRITLLSFWLIATAVCTSSAAEEVLDSKLTKTSGCCFALVGAVAPAIERSTATAPQCAAMSLKSVALSGRSVPKAGFASLPP